MEVHTRDLAKGDFCFPNVCFSLQRKGDVTTSLCPFKTADPLFCGVYSWTSSCTLHKARDQQLCTPQSKGSAAVHSTNLWIVQLLIPCFVECTAANSLLVECTAAGPLLCGVYSCWSLALWSVQLLVPCFVECTAAGPLLCGVYSCWSLRCS